MSEHQIWSEISDRITQATGRHFKLSDRHSIGGGCINQVYLISNHSLSQPLHSSQDRYLLKLNQADLAEMFGAEARGLSEMTASKTMRVPDPICWGVSGDRSYLAIEYLDLTHRANPQSWTQMGCNLAAMHRYRVSSSSQFGWHIDNTIGTTPQINTWETDWVTFFTNHRIGYQLQLARHKGGHFPKATELLAAMPQLLANKKSQPSLVHGDLWSGNASFTTDGIPVLYDPATYWGDREVDLAMTELFGGFPAAFYQGYDRIYPLDPGYSERKSLYNLYHILNHYNLFGGSYQNQANSTIDSLLKL